MGPRLTGLRLTRPRLIASTAVVALALAGCGSSSTSSSDDKSGGTTNASFQKFQECLSEHGVKLPSGGALGGARSDRPPAGEGSTKPPTGEGSPRPKGGFGAGGAPSSSMLEAIKACSKYAPSGGRGGGFPGSRSGGVPGGASAGEAG
jgi:hypothetical protein